MSLIVDLSVFPDTRTRDQFGYAIAASIVLHLLFLAVPMRERTGEAASAGSALPLVVELAPPVKDEPAVVAKAEPLPAPPPRPVPPPVPRELTVPKAPRAVPALPPEPEPPPEPARRPEPAIDMAAFIQANRERRRAEERAAVAGQGAPRSAPGDSAGASLERNLQSLSRSDGTGGVFTILHKGARYGQFSFNGWTPERRKTWKEVIEVDAGAGGDVERAIVRRMIGLIRLHYDGNFNWESHRLGRVVVLSAAPADNEGLEEFMMREFFGTPVVRRGR